MKVKVVAMQTTLLTLKFSTIALSLMEWVYLLDVRNNLTFSIAGFAPRNTCNTLI